MQHVLLLAWFGGSPGHSASMFACVRAHARTHTHTHTTVQLAVMGILAGFYVAFGFSFCAVSYGAVSNTVCCPCKRVGVVAQKDGRGGCRC